MEEGPVPLPMVAVFFGEVVPPSSPSSAGPWDGVEALVLGDGRRRDWHVPSGETGARRKTVSALLDWHHSFAKSRGRGG